MTFILFIVFYKQGGIKVKIIRTIIRFVQALLFVMFCYFIGLLNITGHPYNLVAAAIVLIIAAIIEIDLSKKDKEAKKQESICMSL